VVSALGADMFNNMQRRPTLFGELMEDVSLHEYLALRVRVGGQPQSRHSYFVNIQTDGPIATDLWQHRLYFNRDDGGWEDIFVRFPRVFRLSPAS
jgi:NADH dehydrogenase [ubiquinone] 1 alpha subcomplex assembly factor 1